MNFQQVSLYKFPTILGYNHVSYLSLLHLIVLTTYDLNDKM